MRFPLLSCQAGDCAGRSNPPSLVEGDLTKKPGLHSNEFVKTKTTDIHRVLRFPPSNLCHRWKYALGDPIPGDLKKQEEYGEYDTHTHHMLGYGFHSH